jgi:hypothetical protein
MQKGDVVKDVVTGQEGRVMSVEGSRCVVRLFDYVSAIVDKNVDAYVVIKGVN